MTFPPSAPRSLPPVLTSCVKNQRLDITVMSLVTCSKVFRPWLNLFRPAADPSRFNGCRRFIFLQEPSNFVSGRSLSRHRSKRNPQRKSECPFFETGLAVLALSFLGQILIFVSMLSICLLPCTSFVSTLRAVGFSWRRRDQLLPRYFVSVCTS